MLDSNALLLFLGLFVLESAYVEACNRQTDRHAQFIMPPSLRGEGIIMHSYYEIQIGVYVILSNGDLKEKF